MRRVLAITAELALLIVPIVVALSITGGHPWPTTGDITLMTETGQVSSGAMVRLSMLIGVVLWAWVAVILVRETVVSLRFERDGQPLPAISSGPTGVLKSLARFAAIGTLVGTVTLSALASSTSAPSAIRSDPIEAVQPLAQPRVPVDAQEAKTSGPPVAVIVADGRQTPLSYAVDLGDVTLRDTIIELNSNNERGWIGGVFPVGMNVQLPRPIETRVNAQDTTVAGATPESIEETRRSVDERGRTVTVVKGDNLWNLTEDEFGSTDMQRIRQVARANGIVNPDLIYPGEVIDLGGEAKVVQPEPGESVAEPAGAASAQPAIPTAPEISQPERAPESNQDADADRSERRNVGVDLDDAPPIAVPNRSTEREFAPRTERTVPPPADDELRTTVAGAPVPAVRLLAFDRAWMLVAGVLAFVLARRRRQLRAGRRPAPSDRRMFEVERRLRAAIHPGDPYDDHLDVVPEQTNAGRDMAGTTSQVERIELLAEQAALQTAGQAGRPVAIIDSDDELTVRFTAPVMLEVPWRGDGKEWSIAATDADRLSVADFADDRRSASPMLVQLGRDPADRDVYVDLESLETLEIGGPEQAAEAILAAVAATLASKSVLNAATFCGVGVDADVFLGHSSASIADNFGDALAAARQSLGSTVWESEPPSLLRQSAGGDAWDPAVVIVGANVARVQPAHTPGIAVVSAAPIHGPSHVLAPDGDAWMLRPLEIRLTPIGMYRAEVSAINDLLRTAAQARPDGADDPTLDGGQIVDVAESELDAVAPPPEPDVSGLSTSDESNEPPAGLEREPRVLVRVMGATSVEVDGRSVEFARSKSEELVVWLATHRRRSTRTAAREALWHFDIKNSAFDNIVASARRALDAVAPALPGEDWIGRTTTELLPLHQQVRTDAELIEQALAWAMVRPVEERPAILAPTVQLLRGVPFQGSGYLWPDAEGMISTLANLATRAATELAVAFLKLDDVAGALEATTRGLAVVPGHERLVALRMEALANTGDNTGVRVTWQEYEEVLCADADGPAEPAAELVELRNRLLRAG